MNAFLLLHGYANRRPPEHWQHWLADALSARGHAVTYPQLPDPDAPRLADWQAALFTHLDALARVVENTGAVEDNPDGAPPERIVLCQSLSCLLWLHSAAALVPARRPDRVLLVAPPASAPIAALAPEFALHDDGGPNDHLDVAAVRASAQRELRIVCSDHDPDWNPQGAESLYAAPLGLPCDVIPGAGHLSPDEGYGPWPDLLAWCERPGGPVGPGPH